jgi:hypothetical protein
MGNLKGLHREKKILLSPLIAIKEYLVNVFTVWLCIVRKIGLYFAIHITACYAWEKRNYQ